MKVDSFAVAEPLGAPSEPAAWWQSSWDTLLRGPVFVRYLIVAGVVGVPGSIAQLMAMIWLYELLIGDVGTLTLNALWVVNFEMGLLRNYALHCLFTWRTRPTWGRLRHAHVAASGALVIDLAAFNAVTFATGIVPLAQLAGAGTGFGFNFGYNSLKTFASGDRKPVEGAAE